MPRTIKDALEKAASDKDFAAIFLADPESFRDEYNLEEEQINSLKNLATKPLAELLKEPEAAIYEWIPFCCFGLGDFHSALIQN